MLESVSRTYSHVFALLTVLVFVSCSRTKTFTAQELQSEIASAISLSAETELFMIQIQENRVTRTFDEGHLSYLRDEAARTLSEVRRAQVHSGIAQQLDTCRGQLALLTAELADLTSTPRNAASFSAERERLTRIRSMLEAAKDAL
jgi:hypothetical protein